MQPDQVERLLSLLEQLLFLVQAVSIGVGWISGFVVAQFIIHAKNQKNLF